MALMEYGPRWRKLRKTLGMFASMTEVKKFFPIMELETTVMMHEYLHDPIPYHQHHARFANSVIMTVTFGRRTEKGDKLVVLLSPPSEIIVEHDFGTISPCNESNASR